MIIGGGILKIHPLYSGNHQVYGTVRREQVPADAARVILMDRVRMQVWRETFTGNDGAYKFENIANRTWLVIAQDLRDSHHPDIVRVDSEPMP